ncbi:MAG TPA: GNAT family N-acetyltransferase [Phytomonospora sp.]
MTEPRRATPDDTDELVRLRGVMLSSMRGGEDVSGPWEDNAAGLLREWLAAPDSGFAAFVVDRPGESGRLAACAVAVVHRFLGGPSNPTGRVAYLYNVSTDPEHRRRGHAKACMDAVIGWCREQGIASVDLHASTDGSPLYLSMGFVPEADLAMRLSL